jgi:hypothetical protein
MQSSRGAPVSVLRPDDVSPAAGAALGLAGEEGGGDGGAERSWSRAKLRVLKLWRRSGGRAVHGAAFHLLEEHEHHAVDPRAPRDLHAISDTIHPCYRAHEI